MSCPEHRRHERGCSSCQAVAILSDGRSGAHTTDGLDPTHDGGTPTVEKLPGGQYASHWVMSEDERRRGFVRPVRQHYVHTRCGATTKMGLAIAETYAAKPDFYGSTFCVGCSSYSRVGPDGEFVWFGTDERVGS